MPGQFTRRHFLQAGSAAAAGLAFGSPWARAAGSSRKDSFSFVLMGDLHFDALEHHDMAWVQKDKPNDISQIQNYSRITREVSPALFATVRQVIADLNRSPSTPVRFVLQVGDLVEGLCGSEALSLRQNREAVDFIRDAQLGAPLLFTKGNHDITGPGAVAAFGELFHPFLTQQAKAVSPNTGELKNARYTVDCGNAQFAFFDAYEAGASLEWFESVAAKRTADHLFVVVHPPVVPYGARSNWHVFSSEKDRARRDKFLTLLGDQHALVLGGHIHKYNSLSRRAGKGRFAQFALSSVLNAPAVKPKDQLTGIESYTPDQVRVEPSFSPANEPARRAIYETERKFVHAFEYADLPGYAVVSIDGPRVVAKMFSGATRELWRTVDLTALATA
ncbi:MAG: metallophosphoesterase [Opitutaceae bacterium]|nr:metallophosphoesterase [Opitutaceae bacterium]